jgi:Cys-rich repeat protein
MLHRLRNLPSFADAGVLSVAALISVVVACTPRIAPGKADPGTIGAACGSPEDCVEVTTAECLRISNEGYCTSSCADFGQVICPTGSVCEELGDKAVYCLDGCCSADDCRPGFRCARRAELDIYQDLTLCPTPGVCLARCTSDSSCEVGSRCDQATGQCVPKKGSDAGVGAICSSAGDCNSGTCLSGFPGGYCTSPCGTQFQGCESGSECYALGEGASTCLLLCQNGDDCRAGYRCLEVASGESGKILGYCLPRCESMGCPDGQSCGADGACALGSPSPGPIGAFCTSDAGCQSGRCDTAQPNGYCTADCASCDGPCVLGSCRAACDAEADCRFGYVCESGACVSACRSDAECGAGQVCDSGRCRARATVSDGVVDFLDTTVTVSGEGSERLAFDVPDNALSAFIHASDGRDELMALWQVFAPGETLVYDIGDPVNSRFVTLPTDGNFSALLPPGPVFNFVPGTYQVSFLRDGGAAPTNVRVFGKVGSGFPDRQRLDLVLTFVSAPEGLNANAARTDSDFQRAMTVFDELYGRLGVDLGEVVYEDLDASSLRTIDSVDGPGNELGALFSKSRAAGQGINFFFVQEIVGGDEGFIILGIAGGIPGPPAIMGTRHSGVALTMMGFRDSPKVLGQTMAHEGGHYLGLFHTSESNGTSHDPLPDTAQCKASNDGDFDGYVTTQECAGKGAENFMFWLADENASQVSVEQGRVLRRNPATK